MNKEEISAMEAAALRRSGRHGIVVKEEDRRPETTAGDDVHDEAVAKVRLSPFRDFPFLSFP